MSELIVIGYQTPEQAEEARVALLGMAGDYLVDVGDAVVATADDKGNIKLNQMVNLWTYGASGGAFWGILVGLLFLHPLLGVAAGAASGALMGALTDYGINDGFMKKVAAVLQPGQAALFIMARKTSSDRVLEKLGEHGGHIIRTNLDTTQEQRVREAFEKSRQQMDEAA
ncbi:MAG: DUF1269 domain-containing protein [Rhodobiaceae bacterium]|nr:DUF1269 domain-containing protein [Rhodobiaceae bacterium]